jgi:hypothetical protein
MAQPHNNFAIEPKYKNSMNKINYSTETAEKLAADNPWLSIAKEIEESGYKNPTCSVHRDDRSIVEAYNAFPSTTEEHRLQLNLPPEPFWGNPLTAEVAILMLNPGYLEPYNVDMYDVLDEASQKEFIKAKCDTMSMRDEWCVPTKDVMDKKLASIINLIGGNYWIGKSDSKLNTVFKTFSDANSKIATIQLLGYHSTSYKNISKSLLDGKSMLPTQEYAVRLVRYMMQQGKVLVIRSKRWYEYIPELNPKCKPEFKKYENSVLFKNSRNPILAPNHIEDGGWEKITAALAKEKPSKIREENMPLGQVPRLVSFS